MNVLAEIHFPKEIEYFSIDKSEILGKQWKTGFLTNVSNITFGLGDDNSYQAVRCTLLFNDINGYFKQKFNDDLDKYMQGSKVILRTETGDLIATLNIQYTKFLQNNQFKIEVSDRNGEMNLFFTERITQEEFPKCPKSAVENRAVKPIVFGEMVSHVLGTTRIYQVVPNNFLISGNQDETVTLHSAFLNSGTNITASCSVSTPADGNTYITYSGTNPDFIYVNVTRGNYKGKDPQKVLKAILETHTGFSNPNYKINPALTAFFSNMGYTRSFRGYAITGNYTIAKLRKDFSESHNVNCITDKNGETKVKFINLNALSNIPSLFPKMSWHFQEGSFLNFETYPEPEHFANKFLSNAQYNYRTETFLKTFEYDHFESQQKYGIKTKTINAKFAKDDETAVFNVKYAAVLNQKPINKIVAEFLNINDFIKEDIEIGDLIKIKHSNAETNNFRLYQVRQINANYQKDELKITCYDLTFLEKINTNVLLYIKGSGGGGYLDHFDFSINQETGNHVLNPKLSIENASTKFFNNSSVRPWGYRYIDSPHKPEWNIFSSFAQNQGEDYIISAYFYPTDWSQAYTTAQPILEHYQDLNNGWGFRFSSAQKIAFYRRVAGTQITLIGTTTIPANAWANVVFVKIGKGATADLGLYVNGTQEAFLNIASTSTNTGLMYIAGNQPRALFAQGYFAEIYLIKDNILSLSPNSGLSDSFPVWWHPLGDRAKRIILKCYNPRKNEKIKRGKIYRIKWNIPNIWVKIDLYDNSATPIFVKTIKTVVGNQMFFDWNIGATETIAKRRIKVTSRSGNISAFSELFDII